MTETLKEISVRLEHFETPSWAAAAILKKEILTESVWDPCSGAGILSETASFFGYMVRSTDIFDWSSVSDTIIPFDGIEDFLMSQNVFEDDFTIFMNPPFSKAVEFVEKSIELGARKIVCFQRFAWWESAKRRDFWQKNPPNRIYICQDRADCWRHDIPEDERGSSSPTAHAWFVWEKGHPAGTVLGHISKKDI